MSQTQTDNLSSVYAPILGKQASSTLDAEQMADEDEVYEPSSAEETNQNEMEPTKDEVSPEDLVVNNGRPAIQVVTPSRDILWPEFTVDNAKTKTAFGYFMVPIVTMGTWEHPWYGEVKFDVPTVNQMVDNFNNNVCCYDPALYVGHPSIIDAGGRPAAGFLEVLVLKEDVLWGIFAAVDEAVYLDVKKGKYRYSSAEIVTNYLHTQTLVEYGPTITGCALTNEPFLTNMPAVKAFSQPNVTGCTARTLAFSNRLDHNKCVKDNVTTFSTPMTDPTPSVDDAQSTSFAAPALSSPAIPAPQPDLALSAAVAAQGAEIKELKLSLTTVNERMAELMSENLRLKEARQQDIRDKRFSIVQQANLSAAARQAFTTALSSPTLDDATADEIIAQVKTLSTQEEDTYLSQQGRTQIPPQEVPASTTPNPGAKTEFAYQNFLQERAARLQHSK